METRDSTTRYELRSGDRTFTLDASSGDGGVFVELNDRRYRVVLKSAGPDLFEGSINGKPLTLRIEKETGSSIVITLDGETMVFERPSHGPERGEKGRAYVSKRINVLASPMPGRVVALKAKKGQRVRSGDPLMVIESMKMETLLTSDRDGMVAEIAVGEGEAIQRGQTLIVYDSG
jgi:biotin carboxyl carrier protein